MKKYLIFAWYRYYPNGGLRDLKETTDTFEEALVVFNDLKSPENQYDNIQIIDRDTLEVLRYE